MGLFLVNIFLLADYFECHTWPCPFFTFFTEPFSHLHHFESTIAFWVFFACKNVLLSTKTMAILFSPQCWVFLLFFQKSLKFMVESVLRKPLIYMYVFSPPDLLFFAFFFTMFFFSEEFMLSGLTAPFFFVVVDTLLEKLFVSLP